MPTLSFCGNSYTVDHAVKGSDYIHGYDADGACMVSLEGITDFSGINYDGTYVDPNACLEDPHNDVKFCNGRLMTRSGEAIVTLSPDQYGDTLPTPGIPGRIFFKRVT